MGLARVPCGVAILPVPRRGPFAILKPERRLVRGTGTDYCVRLVTGTFAALREIFAALRSTRDGDSNGTIAVP